MESSHAQHIMWTFGRALRNNAINLMSDSQRDSRFIEIKLLSPSGANLYLVLLESIALRISARMLWTSSSLNTSEVRKASRGQRYSWTWCHRALGA